MNAKENAATTDKKEHPVTVDQNARVLREEELDAVSGGATAVEYAAVMNTQFQG